MNVANICSSFTNLLTLTNALDNSDPEFKRGVFDMCTAFNLKASVITRGTPGYNDVFLTTPNGWQVGRLMYVKGYVSETVAYENYFKYISPAIKKARGDARSDRNSRAATKMKDLIKVVRTKKEIMSDEQAFEREKRGIAFAYGCVRNHMEGRPKPKIVIGMDAVEPVFRAVFDGAPLPEGYRVDMEQARVRFFEEKAAYEEALTSIAMYHNGCYAVGIYDWDGNTNYFLGKVQINYDTKTSRTEVIPQGPMKRYSTLVGTPLETDAAIIRTYMQAKPNYEVKNEFGLTRRDNYYSEIEVTTGYAADTMMWVLLPERA